MDDFTIVFYDMATNGGLAGKTVRTDDDDWWQWQGNYRINRDGTVVLFEAYDWRQTGASVVAGRWYKGH